MNFRLKIVLIWIAPFLLGPIYDVIRILLHHVYPHLVGAPTTREVFSVVLLELLSSPLWIAVGYLFTWGLGGVAVVYIIRALAHNKFLKRKFVISTKDGEDLDTLLKKESGEPPSNRTFQALLTRKNFSLCLALTLSINLFYTIALQRYFSDIVKLPSGTITGALYRYLLSPKLIVSDFLLALLFIPLVTMVVPLFLGAVSIRQIDSSRFDIFWLTLIYSAVGGASLVLFLVTEFESKQATSYFIIAIFLVYGILSWYAALGINLALPAAEQLLASQLLELKKEEDPEQKTQPTNIIFGHIYAGRTKDDVQQV